MKIGYIRNLVDFIMKMQAKFRPDLAQFYEEGHERVARLNILGTTGETLLLKEHNGSMMYAQPGDKAVDIFQCSEDTFLDILTAAIGGHAKGVLRQKWGNNNFRILNAETGETDIVQIEKWARAFDTWGNLLSMAGLTPDDLGKGDLGKGVIQQ